MVIRITIEVDEDRLFEAGTGTTDAEIRAAIEALTVESWLSLQRREHRMPVRNLRIRARLDVASMPKAGAAAAH